MTAMGFILIVIAIGLIISVMLNSWENAWNVLTGQVQKSGQLFLKDTGSSSVSDPTKSNSGQTF